MKTVEELRQIASDMTSDTNNVNKYLSEAPRIANFLIGYDYASSRSMESQWISVEERLPSEDEIILCLTNSGQSVCEYVNYNDNKSRFYLNDLDYYCELENVTHWMPLPENPPIN
mgnify:CR=1 FL=1